MKFITYAKLALFAAILSSCNKNEFKLYTDDNGLYFQEITEERAKKDGQFSYSVYHDVVDSLSYSFKYENEAGEIVDTVYVKVKINGVAPERSQEYEIEVDPGSSAIEGVHYKLPESFSFSAEAYLDSFPVVLYRTDLPRNGGVSLELRIQRNANFPFTIDEFSTVKIHISDTYYKPWYWDRYVNFNLGDFHPLKMQKIIETIGTHRVDLWRCTSTILKWDSVIGGTVYWYFVKNEIYDEDGNRVTVPNF